MSLRKIPVQKRAVEKVELILKHSAILFSQKGYDSTTTRDIAQVSELPVGTIYQFFSDKKAILLKLADVYGQKLDEFYSSLSKSNVAGLTDEEFIDSILDPVLEFDQQNPQFFLIFNFSNFTPELKQAIDELDKKIVYYEGEIFRQRNPKFNPALFEFQMSFLFKSVIFLLLKYKASDDEAYKVIVIEELKRLFRFYLGIFFGEN